MNCYSFWRYLLFVLLILMGVIYAFPNLYGEDPAIQISEKKGRSIRANLEKEIKSNLNAQNIPYQDFQRTIDSILVRFPNTEAQLKAQDIIQGSLDTTNYSVSLNLAPRTPKWLQAIGAKPMRLGLDLRGGIHFLLNVDVNAILKMQDSGDIHSIVSTFRKARVRYTSITTDSEGIIIDFYDMQACKQGINLLKKTIQRLSISRSRAKNSKENSQGSFTTNPRKYSQPDYYYSSNSGK